MQIVKVMGGLGNQMFAYAFALRLRSLGREVKLDTSWYDRVDAHNGWELDRVFELDIQPCTVTERDRLGDVDRRLLSIARRKLFGAGRKHFTERGPGYDSRYLGLSGDTYFDGFWQSPRYHEGIGGEIESSFSFKGELEGKGRDLIAHAAERLIIGVHVRRGDYVGNDSLGEVCTKAYFQGAIEILLHESANPLLVYFSDDLEWCRRELESGAESIFVDWNLGTDSWRDMRLMTRCDRLVLSNSSFSWWGARLSRATKVIAPSRWYGGKHADNMEIALPTWIRLGSRGEG